MDRMVPGLDGLALEASIWRETGMPVLFLHGFSNDRHVWQDVALGLPERYRPVAFDLRGHGESDWSIEGRYHPLDHARDVSCVLDALEIDRAFVVGHSLGGSVATLFAAARPERVAGLVLVDTGPSLSTAAWQSASDDVAQTARSYAAVDEFRALLGLAYPFGDAVALDRLARSSLVERADGRYEPRLDPLLLENGGTAEEWEGVESMLWSALGKLDCPAMVLRGDRSAMLSEEVTRRMVGSALEDGYCETIPSAGHAVAIDNGPALLEAITRFLDAQLPPGLRDAEGTCRAASARA